MNRTDPVCRVCPTSLHKLRDIVFQRGVGMTNENLPKIAQAMLDMFERMCSVRQVADANDVQAVELVEKRHMEGAVMWTKTHETVRREKGSPFVVVIEREVVLASLHAQACERYLHRQL